MKKALALLLALALLAPAPAQQVLKKLLWGRYGVRIERADIAEQLLRIVQNGRTQITIRDYDLSARFVEITGRAPKELWVYAYSGGAHCCFTSYLFTQEEGLHNLLDLFHGNGGMEVKDLDGDGRGELVVSWDYGYFGGLCFACSPVAVSVYKWDGARFYDATLELPGPTRAKAEKYLRACRNALASGASADELEGLALGYWANMLRLGRGAEARRWLMQQMPPEVRRWLLRHEVEIINSASPLPRTAAKELPAKDR